VGKFIIVWNFAICNDWVIFILRTSNIQVRLWHFVLFNFILTTRFHTYAKIFHPIHLTFFHVFSAPAIVDVSTAHYFWRLLIDNLILVLKVHIRLWLISHFVLAQDGVIHIICDIFLRPPSPILLSLYLRFLPSSVRVTHVKHGFIHDGSAEYKLVLIGNIFILFELSVVFLW